MTFQWHVLFVNYKGVATNIQHTLHELIYLSITASEMYVAPRISQTGMDGPLNAPILCGANKRALHFRVWWILRAYKRKVNMSMSLIFHFSSVILKKSFEWPQMLTPTKFCPKCWPSKFLCSGSPLFLFLKIRPSIKQRQRLYLKSVAPH